MPLWLWEEVQALLRSELKGLSSTQHIAMSASYSTLSVQHEYQLRSSGFAHFADYFILGLPRLGGALRLHALEERLTLSEGAKLVT